MSIVGLAVVLALCIPLAAIFLDSEIGRAIAARLQRERTGSKDDPATIAALERRIELLEGDVEILQQNLAHLREEAEFVQRLLKRPGGDRELPGARE